MSDWKHKAIDYELTGNNEVLNEAIEHYDKLDDAEKFNFLRVIGSQSQLKNDILQNSRGKNASYYNNNHRYGGRRSRRRRTTGRRRRRRTGRRRR